VCVCVCVCVWVGGWLYGNYFGNFSSFLLLNLDQTVHLYFICSNYFEKAAYKSHLYECVTTLRTHCSGFFGLSSSVICPVTNSSMYVFWLVFFYTVYILLFLQFFSKISSWSSIRIHRHSITSAFRSSYEVLLFSSDYNQITFEWSAVVAISNTNFPENPSSGSRVIQTDRQDKLKLFSKLFCEDVYNIRMTAAGINSLLYVIMFNCTVSVYYCAELRFLQQYFWRFNSCGILFSLPNVIA
jgi:hypothetical protein